MVLDLCRHVLSLGGYKVLSARGGEEALTFFQTDREGIHLALLDVMMPGMNGFELGQRIQTASPQTKVVLMSGYHSSDVAKITGEDMVYAIIWKPFRAESLLRMVENVLKTPIRKLAAAKPV
jgi:DNA-binding NtrC family response regulator